MDEQLAFLEAAAFLNQQMVDAAGSLARQRGILLGHDLGVNFGAGGNRFLSRRDRGSRRGCQQAGRRQQNQTRTVQAHRRRYFRATA